MHGEDNGDKLNRKVSQVLAWKLRTIFGLTCIYSKGKVNEVMCLRVKTIVKFCLCYLSDATKHSATETKEVGEDTI